MARLVYAVVASAVLSAQGGSVQAAEPRAAVQGELEPALRASIVQAIGETDRPISNRFEARRRARAAAEDAITVLRSEGYYSYAVDPEVSDDEAPKPSVKIAPGVRFVLADPHIDWIGPPPDVRAVAAAQTAMALNPGEPGRAVDVVGAEGRVVAIIQQRGYADVEAQPREVVVDHADHTVRPTYKIVAGQLVKLGGLDVTTDGRTDRAWLRGLTPWRPGDAYNPDAVGELERRLLDTGVYNSVTVALAGPEAATKDGLRPVVVSLAERKRRTLELGASYATSEGAGLDAKWTRYNLLGRADTASVYGRVSNLDSRAGVELSLPHWRKPQRTLKLGAAAYRVRTDAYDEMGVGLTADITRRYGRTSYFTLGASADLSRTDELQAADLTPLGRDVATFALLSDLALDKSDDPLDPRHGWRVSARVEPTVLVGETNLPYLRVQTQGSVYYPIGKQAHTVVAARLRLGSIVNGSIPSIPASRRFYAGGGGSVRGFGYQAVGPRLSDDTPQGGLSLLETSVEIRQDIGAKWGMAAFVDAGAIGTEHFPTLGSTSIGVGVGARYRLPFGPIRVDVATPLTSRRGRAPYQIYVSLGQSF